MENLNANEIESTKAHKRGSIEARNVKRSEKEPLIVPSPGALPRPTKGTKTVELNLLLSLITRISSTQFHLHQSLFHSV